MQVWPSSQPTIETWALLHDLAPDKEKGYCQVARGLSSLLSPDGGPRRHLVPQSRRWPKTPRAASVGSPLSPHAR